MKIVFAVSVFVLSISVGFGQRISEKEMVGFGCWFSGTQTKPVAQTMELLGSKNYDAIRKNLTSRNTAKQYLAVVILTKLEDVGTVDLTKEEREKIRKIKKSKKKVAYCSGCTDWDELTLEEAFREPKPHRMNYTTNFWILRTIEKKH